MKTSPPLPSPSGFDDIKGDWPGTNLASVVLSRATKQTLVVYAADSTSLPELVFREGLHAAVGARKQPE